MNFLFKVGTREDLASYLDNLKVLTAKHNAKHNRWQKRFSAYNNDIPAFKIFLEFTQKLMQDLGDAFIIKLECGHAAGFFSAAPEQFKLSIRRKEF